MKLKKPTKRAAEMPWYEDLMFRGASGPVTVNRVPLSFDVKPHCHDFTELTLILEGSATHEFEGGSYAIGPGDCFLIETGQCHGYHSSKRLKLVNVLIRASFMEKFGAMLREAPGAELLFLAGKPLPARGASMSPKDLDACLLIVDEIERESMFREDQSTMLTGLFLELFAKICRRLRRASGKEADRRAPWLTNVLNHLESHYHEKTPMSCLRKIAGMSERAFERHFKTMTGLTPLQHLTRFRIANACRLLRETDQSTCEIAHQCGMPNYSHFCRQFKSVTGYTPKAYKDTACTKRRLPRSSA